MNRDELKARLMAEAEAAIDEMLAHKPEAEDITLSDIERLAIGSGKEFRAAVLACLVQDSQAEQAVAGWPCPQCGQAMHYKGKRAKMIVTEAGEVCVERDYYYCAACKHGVFPPG